MAILVLLLGCAVGLAVGLMGVGGGIVVVPALVYLLGFGQHLAQGTSLFLQLPPIGLGALLNYWRNGHVDMPAGLACAAGMFVGGYFGSLVALNISARELEAIFGVFLMGTALLLWRQAWGDPRRPRARSVRAEAVQPATPAAKEQS